MLKYVAITTAILLGYLYFGPTKTAVRPALLQIPKTKAQALKNTKPFVSHLGVSSHAPQSNLTNLNTFHNTEKKFTYPEIQKMIVNDDVCALNKLIHEMSAKGDAPIYVDALFEALNLDNYKELFGVEGP
ncbi:MAG: hypothetical protein IT287_02190, partial [Bdellovibrionaceae bacterium]|nr:hypothetical protein [Pseudobdellovibrionaceae bacterium]